MVTLKYCKGIYIISDMSHDSKLAIAQLGQNVKLCDFIILPWIVSHTYMIIQFVFSRFTAEIAVLRVKLFTTYLVSSVVGVVPTTR